MKSVRVGAVTSFLCAPNAFKGTLSAREAAAALAAGIREAGGEAMELPVADGGDGTLDVLLGNRGRIEPIAVTGPKGNQVSARLGWLDDVAVVELADAAGLRLLGQNRDAMRATTHGVGEIIRAALDRGASEIIVGVGGSATTDGGVGALQALGFSIHDSSGREVGPGGAGLIDVASIDSKNKHRGMDSCVIYVAADVTNPLLGPNGSAHVFAPQKGASAEEVEQLDKGLALWAEVAADFAGVSVQTEPGAGAAGGTAFGLAALCGAKIVPGAKLVCDRLQIDAAISSVDVVITGEGRLDAQTAQGKAPQEVARRCAAKDRPCVAIAASVSDNADRSPFAKVIDLHGVPADADDCRRRLHDAGVELQRQWAGP
jgi:glycerate kinase